MKRGIHIYINDEELELDGNATVLFNYATKDIQNPTIVRNTFSKKITVPGTPNNNRIFGSIWNLEGGQFNAGAKAPFTIYVDDEVYETGYAKLDEVNRKWNTTTYSVSLFGGLGDFFYSLAQRQEDSDGVSAKKTLADLVYRYEDEQSAEVDLDFDITMRTVKEAWDNVAGWSTKWRFINFAPAYNGTPSDFDSDKVLNYGYREEVIDDNKHYLPYANWWVIDQLQRDHTGPEMREFRSYLQRPVIRTMEVIKACCLPENNGGYTVNLDPAFFNNDNPYWVDAYSTLPLLSSLQYTGQEDAGSGFTVSVNNTYDTGGVKGVWWSGYTETRSLVMNNPDEKAFNIKADFALEAVFDSTPSPSTYSEVRTVGWNTQVNTAGGKGGRKRGDFGIIAVQLVAYDPFNQAIAGSKIALLTSQLENGSYMDANDLTEHGWTSVYGNDYILYPGAFKYDSGRWVWENAITLTIENVPSNCTVKLIVDKEYSYLRTVYGGNAKVLSGYDPSQNRHFFTRLEMNHFNVGLVGYEATVTTGEGVRSGAHITKEMLLSTDFTPADYLLSYCKLFGLYFRKDPAHKVIDILTRGNFYNGGIEDLSERIDRDDVKITPITFDKKWYNFGLEESESEYGEDYKKVYGVEYGDALINTGYEFNSETEEVFSGNIFKSAIQALERSDAFAVITEAPEELVYTRRGFSYSLYNNNVVDDTYEVEVPAGSTFDVTTGMDGENRYYDLFSKVQLHTADNSPADGSNVLLFYTGLQQLDTPTKELRYRITDDNEIMYKLNDGTPCWLMSQSEYDQYGHEEENRIMINADYCPTFSRYILYGASGVITKSWDFGEPKTLYIPGAVSTPDGTLYNECWKNYISDLYNKDTRIVETMVRWGDRVTIDTLRKFYWFDNNYWVVSKITDWNMIGRGLTKTEFVKVNDPANYDTVPISKDPDLKIELSAYEVPITGGTISFTAITSDNGSWYAEYNSDYVTMSPDSASASTTGTITVGANTGSGDRDIQIMFCALPTRKIVTIAQRAYAGEIRLTGPGVIPYSGGSTTFEVVSPDGPWSIDNAYYGFVSVSPSAGTATQGTQITATFADNSNGNSERSMYLRLRLPNGSWARSSYVIQQAPYSISLSHDKRTFDLLGGTNYVWDNHSGGDFMVAVYPLGTDWATVTYENRSANEGATTIVVQPNTTGQQRTCTIFYYPVATGVQGTSFGQCQVIQQG